MVDIYRLSLTKVSISELTLVLFGRYCKTEFLLKESCNSTTWKPCVYQRCALKFLVIQHDIVLSALLLSVLITSLWCLRCLLITLSLSAISSWNHGSVMLLPAARLWQVNAVVSWDWMTSDLPHQMSSTLLSLFMTAIMALNCLLALPVFHVYLTAC